MDNIDNIDELIGKFLSGEASPKEAILLEDWKNSSSENLRYYTSCATIFDASVGQEPSETDKKVAWKKIKNAIDGRGKIKPLFFGYWKLAASLAIVVSFASVLFYLFRKDTVQLISFVAQETEKKIAMADSSLITVSAYSQVSYASDFGKTNRTVLLKGSAYFSVTHKDSLPFIVDAEGLYIKDIGTKFNVTQSENKDTVFVRVDEGSVSLYDNINSEVVLIANEKATYIKPQHKILKVKKEVPATAAVLKFDFNKQNLSDIIAELSHAYGTNIELESVALGNCQVTTQFSDENIETVLMVITETLGLKFVKTADGYLIKGNKCNG